LLLIEDFSGGNEKVVRHILSNSIVSTVIEIMKSVMDILDDIFRKEESRDFYLYQNNN
jgi:hypothetical protein